MRDMRHVCMMRAALALSSFGFAYVFMSGMSFAGEFPESLPCYGVCAHLSRDEFAACVETCDMMSLAGLGYVRSDFEWKKCQRDKDGAFEFSQFDKIIADADSRGITVLPILYDGPGWAHPVHEHLEEFRLYIRNMISRYGMKMPVVEIWNEENSSFFWKGMSPTNYLTILKVAYEAVKSVEPRVRVSFGGTAGVPFDFIEEIYRLGGAKYFDILSIHPYTHPAPPEGRMDVQIEKLRALMAKYGDEEKPVWITEFGCPTHTPSVGVQGLLSSALRLARPEKKSWNVVFAACVADDAEPPVAIAESIRAALPPGSTAVACTPREVCRRLASGGVDAVVYPFDEQYPADTVNAVVEFVKNGGTLVDFGGMPMWFPCRTKNGAFGRDPDHDPIMDRRRLRIQEDAWFMGDKSLPENMTVFATSKAAAAGLMQDPSGFSAARFQTDSLLAQGDKMIPLLVGTNPKNGKTAVAACVYAFDSDYKGRVVVSGLYTPGNVNTVSEDRQAVFLARAAGIAFAERVESFFWYEFRSPERDPFYSEHHFGIVHENFTPKPAYGAYMNFVKQRPLGSVQIPGAWHDEKRTTYFPQWTRPDGRRAGMCWSLGKACLRELKFSGDVVEFRDVRGKRIVPVKTGPNAWLVPVGEEPVYFIGARILNHQPSTKTNTQQGEKQ